MKGTSSNSSTRRTTHDGFIVVAVLWILGTLSALVSIYAVYVINTASGFAVHDQRLHAEALVSAAIELTAYRQLTARALSRPTRGQFNFQLGQADIAVEFRSETARIDLNAAPKQLLAGLFLALGEHRDRAEIYSDRIVGWRTAPTSSQDPEDSAYRVARLGYGPRGAKFPHASELSLVRDLPMSVVERVLPFVTVYSGRPQINVFDAAPEVIAALPGMTPERLDAVLKQRQALPRNEEALLPLLGAAQQFSTTEGGNAIRLTVRITFDSGRRANSEVIILVFEAGDKPYAVLSWSDEQIDRRMNDVRWAGLR